MRGPIPYIARSAEDTAEWVEHLRAAMPDERVVAADGLSTADREAVRVAIVADPDPAVLATFPALEWVQSTWAGVERMLKDLPPDIGIARMVDPRLAEVMSEAALTAVLWLHRDGPRYAAQQKRRVWREHRYVRPGNRSVAVLGLGELGRAAAGRIAANGFRTLGWSRGEKRIDGVETRHGASELRRTLADADVVVNLLPHTRGTDGLLGADACAAMRNGASLVNFGRGATVDEGALLQALDEGRIAHALLDVFAVEPLPEDHPFWAHERVTVWPHVAGPTDPATASRVVADAIGMWRRTGTPPALVDRSRGY